MRLLNKTIGECLEERALQTPDRVAAGYMEESYTWRQLDGISDRLAAEYLRMGIRKGTHAGIWAVNSFNWIACYFALVKIGAVPVLINICYKEMELEETLRYADVEYLFHGFRCKDVDFGEVIRGLDPSRVPRLKKTVAVESMDLSRWKSSPGALLLTEERKRELGAAEALVRPEDVGSILFTSGTTGSPKGVMLTHRSLVNNSAEQSARMRWTGEDSMCLSVPLFHCFGITAGILAAMHCGACIRLVKYYSTEEVLATIETYRCTILSGVPSMFLALVRSNRLPGRDVSSLKSGIVAGSPITPEDYAKICRVLGIGKLQVAYGQTESSPCITMSEYDDGAEDKAASAGKAVPNVEVRIWDCAAGKEAAAGRRGEIQTRGYHVMKGYYNLPEDTARAVTPEGWLRTGDEGYLDDRGYLHVTGRFKEMIIRGGENISPAEIEACIRMLEFVREVKVVGLAAEVMQEEIVACVIPEKGGVVNEGQIQVHVRQNLSTYKTPRYVVAFDRFPLTPSGKIDLKELKEQAARKIAARGAAASKR